MNCIYKLDEMLDSMTESIATVRKVIGQQEKLVKLLAGTEDEDFDSLKKGVEEQIDNYKEQLNTLTVQYMRLSNITNDIRGNSEFEAIVSELMVALRIVEE